VNTGPVLDIHFITNTDKVHITPYHGIEPGTAIITHDHVSHDRCVGGYETVIAKLRVFIFYRK
jgi:hypothetical protein